MILSLTLGKSLCFNVTVPLPPVVSTSYVPSAPMMNLPVICSHVVPGYLVVGLVALPVINKSPTS